MHAIFLNLTNAPDDKWARSNIKHFIFSFVGGFAKSTKLTQANVTHFCIAFFSATPFERNQNNKQINNKKIEFS